MARTKLTARLVVGEKRTREEMGTVTVRKDEASVPTQVVAIKRARPTRPTKPATAKTTVPLPAELPALDLSSTIVVCVMSYDDEYNVVVEEIFFRRFESLPVALRYVLQGIWQEWPVGPVNYEGDPLMHATSRGAGLTLKMDLEEDAPDVVLSMNSYVSSIGDQCDKSFAEAVEVEKEAYACEYEEDDLDDLTMTAYREIFHQSLLNFCCEDASNDTFPTDSSKPVLRLDIKCDRVLLEAARTIKHD
jgi:hypothetical protein